MDVKAELERLKNNNSHQDAYDFFCSLGEVSPHSLVASWLLYKGNYRRQSFIDGLKLAVDNPDEFVMFLVLRRLTK